MTSAWAHLPNAAHIDRVIASVLSNPVQWTWVASDPVRHPMWDVRGEAYEVVRKQGRSSVWEEGRLSVLDGARDAILALIAYDDCAYMIDSDPSELAILAAFGDPRASLLLSACKAFHSIKEVV